MRPINYPTTNSRVMLLGDVHGNLNWLVNAVRWARRWGCSHILQLGDFGYWPHVHQGTEFWNGAKELLRLNDLELWWVDGNHENHEHLDAQPHEEGFWRDGPLVHCGRGARWEWNGVRFLACGGAYSVDKRFRTHGVSWWPQETITGMDVLRCGNEPTDILVSHDAPIGVSGVMGEETVGDKDSFPESWANRQALTAVCEATQPRLIVHGHYHHRNSSEWDGGTRVEGHGRDGVMTSMTLLCLPEMAVLSQREADGLSEVSD